MDYGTTATLQPGSDVLLCLATPPSLRIKPFPAPPRHAGFQAAPRDTARWYFRKSSWNW